MIKKCYTINEKTGFPLTPAAMLVNTADVFSCSLMLSHNGSFYNVKSILGLMSAMLRKGDLFMIIADGDDESDAIAAIESIDIFSPVMEEII